MDFSKYKDPEYVKKLEARRKQRQEDAEKTLKAQKFMIEKLMPMVDDGEIDNEWERGFVRSCYQRVVSLGIPLTEKQAPILERIFEKW